MEINTSSDDGYCRRLQRVVGLRRLPVARSCLRCDLDSIARESIEADKSILGRLGIPRSPVFQRALRYRVENGVAERPS